MSDYIILTKAQAAKLGKQLGRANAILVSVFGALAGTAPKAERKVRKARAPKAKAAAPAPEAPKKRRGRPAKTAPVAAVEI